MAKRTAKEVEEIVDDPGVGQVAVVGKQHDFLSEVVVAFVITTAAERPDADNCKIRSSKRQCQTCRLQGAAGRIRRRRVSTGHARQDLKNKLREMADERPPV